MISVMPIAASIPLITDVGTNFAILLALRSQKRICIAPAMISERRKVGKPRFAMAVTTIATSHAAGPETLRGDLLKNQTIIPHMIPAISPLIKGAPLATAIPRHRGTATKKTAIPAGKSCFRYFNIFTFYIKNKTRLAIYSDENEIQSQKRGFLLFLRGNFSILFY